MIETLPLMPVHMSFALSHNTQLAIVVHIEEEPKQSSWRICLHRLLCHILQVWASLPVVFWEGDHHFPACDVQQ